MKQLFSTIAALAMLASCSTEKGPLLKGSAKFLDPETEFAINYTPDGSIFNAQAEFFKLDEQGNFTYDVDLEENEGNYEILIGTKVFGIHLEKGKTAVMNVIETDKGQYALSFSGDNADLCEVMSAAYPAYDLYTYSEMTDDEATPDEFLGRIDKANEVAKAKLNLIKDADKKDYYTQLLDAMYIGTRARILQDKAMAEGVKPIELPEYKAIIERIDPNTDISYHTSNSLLWIGEKVTAEYGGNMLPVALETMDLVDKNITNPKVRKMEAYCVANMFFAYGDHETGKEEFWARYKEFSKDYPEFIERFQKEYERTVTSAEGIALPEIELTKPDDTKVPLSSLYGKYVYVDCWATWCGPCCKEIPHLEKLAAKMKDQDKVVFVSLSMDTDTEAWKRKLEADKPEWAQFILDEAASKALSEALNITGIPRFFIIDPEGKVMDPDAKRPSNDELEAELRSL